MNIFHFTPTVAVSARIKSAILFTMSILQSTASRKIGGYPQCLKCTEPALERYALPYEDFKYLFVLLKEGSDIFLKWFFHQGIIWLTKRKNCINLRPR